MHAKGMVSVILGLVLLAAALAFALRTESVTDNQKPRPLPPVRTAPVLMEMTTRHHHFSAITRPIVHAVLSFTIPGRIDHRPVQVGDRVTAGSLLALLDTREYDNAITMADAALKELAVRRDQARKDMQRFDRLSADNVVAESQREQATTAFHQLGAAVAGARAKMAEARRLRAEAELCARFPAVVTAVYLQPGEWANPGQPVVRLVDDRAVEVEVEVPESIIGQLRKDQAVRIRLPFVDDLTVTGRIDGIARAIVSSGQLFPVRIVLDPAPGLVPGLTAEVELDVQTPPRMLIHIAAIVNPGGSRPFVFVLDDGGRVREVAVQLGAFIGDRVVVKGELTADDRVVVGGQSALVDGKKVEVRP